MITKSVSEISICFTNILCFMAFLAMNQVHYVSRITVKIVWLYCLVVNVSISSSVDVIANFAYMFVNRFVIFRFIISNSIPD